MIMVIVVSLLFIVAAILPAMLWQAYVLVTLYGWFIPTAFQQAPAIGYAQMMGISVFWRLLNHHVTEAKDDRSAGEKMASYVTNAFILPLIALGLGWLIRHFGGI